MNELRETAVVFAITPKAGGILSPGTIANTPFWHRAKMNGMSHFRDEEHDEQMLQKSLKRVPEMLRAQGLSEEEIAEGMAGLPDRLPEIRRSLAKFWDFYRDDFAESIARLIDRQGSHFPDFDELYRRKAELDHLATDRPLSPPN